MAVDNADLWTYACDDVRLVRKGRPDVWVQLSQVNGKMYGSYPCFSFPPDSKGEEEPVRYGDFALDIDTLELACPAGVQILEYFERVYGVAPEQFRCYLSGKKGVHLELPASILGTEEGHVYLPLAYKRLAKEIEGELNVKLDTSLYCMGTGRPFRRPNIMRDTGTCKRQIDYSDLYEIETDDEYRAACSEPGPTWAPSDTSLNASLSTKMAAFLAEAEKHQEALQNSRPLTDDERDRLALTIPPCVSALANLTSNNGTSATFNDVAIQLTAYAITTGKTEQEFLDGCHVFIANYPSTSLNTRQKRLDNCRARYRTMAANGYQHSCGGIKALRLGGFDCKKCEAMPNGPIPTVEVMTREDAEEVDLSLHIPDAVRNPGGLISLAMEALPKCGAPDIPQFTLATILTVLARSIAGKLIYQRTWPNVYNIKVGGTSLGKTDTDKAMKASLTGHVPPDFYGSTGFASGPAIMRSLSDSPKSMFVLDECTHLFKRYQHADPISDGIRDALLEIYSKSGEQVRKTYSDSRKNIEIDYPCLSLTGNATPVIFDSIRDEDFLTGTMQRFDWWYYTGKVLQRNEIELENKDMLAFAQAVGKICNSIQPVNGNLVTTNGVPLSIEATPECREILKELSVSNIDSTNAATGDAARGIISRRYHASIKYALIHMAGTRPVEALYQPMRPEDIEYGKAVAWMLADWKLNTLLAKVCQGDFHRDCELFKDAIIAALRTGNRPTFKLMVNRRPALKNWKRKDSEEVIAILVKRGEIVLDESKKPTAYLLAKQGQVAL